MMQTVSRRVLSVVATLVAAGCVVTAANGASTNVVSAIKTQDKVIQHAPGYKVLSGKIKPKSKAQAKQLVADLGKLEMVADHAVDVVAASSTSNAKQREGKRDWVGGSREQNRGILDLQTALQAVISGNKAAFKTHYVEAIKELTAGTKLGIKGDKLLGLPTSD